MKEELYILADLSDIDVNFIYDLELEEPNLKNKIKEIPQQEVDDYFKQYGL